VRRFLFLSYFNFKKHGAAKRATLPAPSVLMGMRVVLILDFLGLELLGPDLLGLFVLLFAAVHQAERQKAEQRATRKANASKNKIHTIFPLILSFVQAPRPMTARFCEEKRSCSGDRILLSHFSFL
jgi:hypothetical protein